MNDIERLENLMLIVGPCDITALTNAIQALKAQAERDQGCEYEWLQEGQFYLDNDDEEPLNIHIVKCSVCGWHFFSDSFSFDSEGYTSQSDEFPHFCIHCGQKLGGDE